MGAAGQSAALPRRKNSIRNHFVALAGLVLVPALMLGGWLALTSAQGRAEELELRAIDDASEIAAMVDRELTNLANILTALSTTYYLQADDLQGFYRQATEVAQRIGIR